MSASARRAPSARTASTSRMACAASSSRPSVRPARAGYSCVLPFASSRMSCSQRKRRCCSSTPRQPGSRDVSASRDRPGRSVPTAGTDLRAERGRAIINSSRHRGCTFVNARGAVLRSLLPDRRSTARWEGKRTHPPRCRGRPGSSDVGAGRLPPASIAVVRQRCTEGQSGRAPRGHPGRHRDDHAKRDGRHGEPVGPRQATLTSYPSLPLRTP